MTPFTIVAHQSAPLLIKLNKLMQLCYDFLSLESFFYNYTVLCLLWLILQNTFIVQMHSIFMKYEERAYANIKVYDIKEERRINIAKSL